VLGRRSPPAGALAPLSVVEKWAGSALGTNPNPGAAAALPNPTPSVQVQPTTLPSPRSPGSGCLCVDLIKRTKRPNAIDETNALVIDSTGPCVSVAILTGKGPGP